MIYRSNPPEWISGQGSESDIVISSRARLARCIDGFPFPFKANNVELSAISEMVCSVARSLLPAFPGLRVVSVDELNTDDKDFLVDCHIISPEHAEGGPGRIVLLDPGGNLSIMVNEEDHLRIQVMKSGLVSGDCWEIIDQVDTRLAQNLPYAYSDQLGYLTCSVSNIGTGLRLSVMMHLTGLMQMGRLSRHLKAANELGVSVRGLHGEGSRPLGDIFQVSNEHTLGMTESELVDKVQSAANYLLTEERIARKELVRDGTKSLVESAQNALTGLKHSQLLSAEKALSLLSVVRLAFETGLVENCSRFQLNSLLTKMMSMYGKSFNAGTIRAKVLREGLKHTRAVEQGI